MNDVPRVFLGFLLVLALLAGALFAITATQPVKSITDAHSEPLPVFPKRCPLPSSGEWCPWYDDGQVQPQPVWP